MKILKQGEQLFAVELADLLFCSLNPLEFVPWIVGEQFLFWNDAAYAFPSGRVSVARSNAAWRATDHLKTVFELRLPISFLLRGYFARQFFGRVGASVGSVSQSAAVAAPLMGFPPAISRKARDSLQACGERACGSSHCFWITSFPISASVGIFLKLVVRHWDHVASVTQPPLVLKHANDGFTGILGGPLASGSSC